MSQSVNVLSCECPGYSDDSQNYKKKITPAPCFVPICKDCKEERMGNTFIQQSVTAYPKGSHCEFDLLERYPHLYNTFQKCYRTLERQKAEGKNGSFEYYIGYKCLVQNEWLNIIICYAACLSCDGQGLHLTIQSCECSDTSKDLEVNFNGKTAINIPVLSPRVPINIYSTR